MLASNTRTQAQQRTETGLTADFWFEILPKVYKQETRTADVSNNLHCRGGWLCDGGGCAGVTTRFEPKAGNDSAQSKQGRMYACVTQEGMHLTCFATSPPFAFAQFFLSIWHTHTPASRFSHFLLSISRGHAQLIVNASCSTVAFFWLGSFIFDGT